VKQLQGEEQRLGEACVNLKDLPDGAQACDYQITGCMFAVHSMQYIFYIIACIELLQSGSGYSFSLYTVWYQIQPPL